MSVSRHVMTLLLLVALAPLTALTTTTGPGAAAESASLQACLYAGSLSQVSGIETGVEPTVLCGRGEPIVLATGDSATSDTALHACLYAGSLSNVGTTPPSSCGRGEPVTLGAGTDLYACLYAGKLSQAGYTEPVNCGRGGPPVALALYTGPADPVASDLSVDAVPSVPVDITLTASDPDSSALTFEVIDEPAHGTLDTTTPVPTCVTVDAGVECTATVRYTGAFGFEGADSFTYRASDGEQESALATASITLAYPEEHQQQVNVEEGGTVELPGQMSLTFEPDSLTCDAIVTITAGPPASDHTDAPASSSYLIELEPVDPPSCLGGVEFYPEALLTIYYDPSAIPLGKTPGDLYIGRFNSGSWGTSGSIAGLDTSNHTVSVLILDFSKWNVFIG